jgi:UDP-glucose:(heptosyl)LPS alpha-1,3-glucosyltransferase
LDVVFLKSQITKRGGLEKYTLRLAAGFQAQGHSVKILTTDAENASLAVPTVSFGSKNPISLFELLRFDKACNAYVKAHTPDIVFGMERNFCPQTHYRAGNGCHAAYLERRKKQEGLFKRLSFAINPLHRLLLSMEKATFESDHLKRLFVNSHMVKE